MKRRRAAPPCSPASPASLPLVRRTFSVRPDHVKAFRRDGCVQLGPCLTRQGLAFIREQASLILRDRHPSVESEWVLQLHENLDAENWMWKLASNEKLVGIARSQLGASAGILLYATQIAAKFPPPSPTSIASGAHSSGSGSSSSSSSSSSSVTSTSSKMSGTIPFHQDGDSSVCTIWVALDDIDRHNGGLRVKRGWHWKGRLKLRPVKTAAELEHAKALAAHNVFQCQLAAAAAKDRHSGESRYSDDDDGDEGAEHYGRGHKRDDGSPDVAAAEHYEDDEEEEDDDDGNDDDDPFLAEPDVISYDLRAGDAATHHPLAPHGSSPNLCQRGRQRRVIILRYMAAPNKLLEGGQVRHWKTGEFVPKKTYLVYAPPVAAHKEEGEEEAEAEVDEEEEEVGNGDNKRSSGAEGSKREKNNKRQRRTDDDGPSSTAWRTLMTRPAWDLTQDRPA